MENYNVVCYLQTGLNMSESTGGLKGKQSHESKLMKDAYLGKKQSKKCTVFMAIYWWREDESNIHDKKKTLQK